jgi:ATP-dependent Lon protease
MKAIQKELGDAEGKDELAEIEDKIKKTKPSKEAREKATHELRAVAGRGGGSGGDRA